MEFICPNVLKIYQIIFLTYNGWVVSKGRRWRDDLGLVAQRLTDTGVKAKLVRNYIKPKY